MPLEVMTPDEAPAAAGLRHEILSPVETLSQSISAIAPTTSPALTVPLVFALAGNGTWLAYLLACGATLLMAGCIARFARTSASPGSLYKYASDSLPAMGGRTAGWALLLAYTATGASVVGGFINYARVLLPWVRGAPTPVLALAATAAATYFAYRDVQASARMMLWIEAASVTMISLVVVALLLRGGVHIDAAQVALRGVTASGVRLGVVLALFSFVGFESATTLGHEAKNPLRTIPRAVVQSAVLAGMFFLVCCYAETMGFREVGQDLGAVGGAVPRTGGAGAGAGDGVGAGRGDRCGGVCEHVCVYAGVHYRGRASAAAHGAGWAGARASQPMPCEE
jgi:amino acid transporter